MIPDVPPRWVLRAASDNLDRTKSFEAYYDVLCGYYGIRFVSAYHNEAECLKLGKDTIAFYRSGIEPVIYTKSSGIEKSLALHEFFHHLIDEKNIALDSEAAERLADSFAMECIRIEHKV